MHRCCRGVYERFFRSFTEDLSDVLNNKCNKNQAPSSELRTSVFRRRDEFLDEENLGTHASFLAQKKRERGSCLFSSSILSSTKIILVKHLTASIHVNE